jgi:ankyrin repeat protein
MMCLCSFLIQNAAISWDYMATAEDVLRRLNEESLPDFFDPLTDVNQVGACGTRPIHVVSYRGNTADVAALVEAGADVNVKGDMDSTPLHDAIEEGHLETAKYLLDHGALTDIKNEFGQTPIDIARRKGYSDILELLLNSGEKHGLG